VSIANQARVAGIQIIPVGILGPGRLNRNILNQIAFPQARLSTVDNYDQLSSVSSQVADWICLCTCPEQRNRQTCSKYRLTAEQWSAWHIKIESDLTRFLELTDMQPINNLTFLIGDSFTHRVYRKRRMDAFSQMRITPN